MSGGHFNLWSVKSRNIKFPPLLRFIGTRRVFHYLQKLNGTETSKSKDPTLRVKPTEDTSVADQAIKVVQIQTGMLYIIY